MREKTTLSVSSYRCIVSLPEKRCIIIGMEKKHYTPEQRTTLFVSVVTAFITTFMGSALNLSVPDIEKDFGVSAAEVGWVVTIYMLTCAALAVPFGRLADMFQRRRILWIGILIFGLSSAAAVISPDMRMLLAFRLGQGVGASMIFSTNIAILVGAFDGGMRGRVLGYSTSATYVGLSAGPVLGGLLNHNFGWRSVFIAAAAVSAVAFYGALKRLPSERKRADKPEMDIKGNILYILSIIALMYGFSTVTSSVYGPYILAAGAILIIFFVRTELTAKDPVIDVRLFRNNLSYTFSNLAALLNYGATFAISYLISIYLQIIMGYDSQTAGMILISSPVVMAVLSPVMGRLSDKYSPYIMSSAGMGLCAAALTLFSFLPEESSVIRIIAILAVSGVGFSLFTSPNTNAVMASVDREDYGIASSVLSTMRSIGHTMSMAVVTLVVGAKMGESSMTTSSPQEVMNTIHMCFYIFTGLCIGGIFIALRRKS